MPSTFVSPSSSSCSGDFLSPTCVSSDAMRPICVRMPVSTTAMRAVPRVTDVFWNTIDVRSASAVSAVFSAGPFGIGSDSPVRDDSCVSRFAERRIRPSAGTRSPDSSSTMSPGTSPVASIWCSVPSRMTRAFGVCSFARASTLRRAFTSCWVPVMTLNSTRTATMIAVVTCPMRSETIVTAMSMSVMSSSTWLSAMRQTLGGGALCRALGPASARRFSASAAASPRDSLGLRLRDHGVGGECPPFDAVLLGRAVLCFDGHGTPRSRADTAHPNPKVGASGRVHRPETARRARHPLERFAERRSVRLSGRIAPIDRVDATAARRGRGAPGCACAPR